MRHDGKPGRGRGGQGQGEGRGQQGRGRGGGGRAQRGDLRLALLLLLAERPMHGYELMAEIAQRTGGVWRPSPGAVYPRLAMLQDEGLISKDDDGSRRTFTITEAGRRAAPTPADRAPWSNLVEAAGPLVAELRAALETVGIAVEQVIVAGTDADRAQAKTLLAGLRRELYLLLAANR